MRIISLLVLFMFLSAFFIISNQNLALKDKDSRLQFARSYYAWFLGFIGNFKNITGAVIKIEWIPDKKINVTNKSK